MRSLIAYLLFYPTLWYNQILCRIFSWRNWWDRIDEHLIIGALPMKRHVKPLHDEGIRAVVNTCNEYSGPLEHYNEHGIDQLRVPTVDLLLRHLNMYNKQLNTSTNRLAMETECMCIARQDGAEVQRW